MSTPEETNRVREENTIIAEQGLGGYRSTRGPLESLPIEVAQRIALSIDTFPTFDQMVDARDALRHEDLRRGSTPLDSLYLASSLGIEILPTVEDPEQLLDEIHADLMLSVEKSDFTKQYDKVIRSKLLAAYLPFWASLRLSPNQTDFGEMAEIVLIEVKEILRQSCGYQNYNPEIAGAQSELVVVGSMLTSIQNELGVIALPALARNDQGTHTNNRQRKINGALNENYDIQILQLNAEGSTTLLEKIQVKSGRDKKGPSNYNYSDDTVVVYTKDLANDAYYEGLIPAKTLGVYFGRLAIDSKDNDLWGLACDGVYRSISENE